MIKGVIFDMDGVILDTEPVSFNGWKGALENLGLSYDSETIHKTIGLDFAATKLFFMNLYKGVDFDRLYKEYLHCYRLHANPDGIPSLKGGVVEILKTLKERDLPVGLATSSSRATAEASLEKTGIRPYFKAILCGGDTAYHKPDPEFYRQAAMRIEVPIDECLVFEDSLPGIRAASDAEASVIRIEDLAIIPEEESYRYKTSYKDFHGFLEEIEEYLS